MTDTKGRPPAGWGLGSDEFLRLIIESTTDFAVIAMDNHGCVTSWNSGAERLLGFSEADMLGHTSDVIFHAEDVAGGVPEQERATARKSGRAEDERWHIRKDGTPFWGSGVAMPLADNSGFVKIIRDLTERRKAEERVRESEQLFRLLATNIPQLVFRTKGDGNRVWGSPQWIAFTGLSLDASLGFGWMDAIHLEDRAATITAWEEAMQLGTYEVEHRIRRSIDGEFRWHQTRANPIADSRGNGEWVGTSTDIDDIRGLQERQKVLLAELQHRTRNLLAVVQSIARQTIDASHSLEDFATEFEGRLRAVGRVQGILEHVDFGSVDLRQLVEAELRAHGYSSTTAGKVTISGPPALMPAASAQALALAVHELATNAVKYGALKQQLARLEITWQLVSAGQRVLLEWRECGVQMPDQPGYPKRRGYGMELIERALSYQLKAETKLEFGADGVRCRIELAVVNAERSNV
jgi:PAS domain S-box-containing protein